MSRRSKGPRLYPRAGRVHNRTGKPVPDVWAIRDGKTEVSTGCGLDDVAGAEKALAEYIAKKWTPGAQDQAGRPGDPAGVFLAEVIALYLRERGPGAPDPSAVAARFKALLGFWGGMTVAEVKRSSCKAYVTHRTAQPIASATKDPANARRVTAQGARRELEDLSAAIGYWDDEHHLDRRPKVTLPEKPESPRDALTRSEAAALLWAALGWRRQADGSWRRLSRSARVNRAHMRRFILSGLYTGTRPGVIPKVLWRESPTQAWADTDDGLIYRRGRAERDQPTKRRPLVKVPDRLLAHMRRWKRLDEESGVTVSTVVHHGGEPVRKVRRAFASCVADAGLRPEITPHWMRHTCATWLLQADVEPWAAAGYTGMTVATLEKCYGHHRPDHQEAARKALGGRR
jgi:integrase